MKNVFYIYAAYSVASSQSLAILYYPEHLCIVILCFVAFVAQQVAVQHSAAFVSAHVALHIAMHAAFATAHDTSSTRHTSANMLWHKQSKEYQLQSSAIAAALQASMLTILFDCCRPL